MKKTVLISPTAYKGTLRPFEAARVIERVVRRERPEWNVRSLPLADGGDGTLDVLIGGPRRGAVRFRSTRVRGPLGAIVSARWAILERVPGFRGRTAVIEMARASGLALVRGKNKILDATTFGTGELIRAALDENCRAIIIGVGGTATADGGAGALEALGLRYFDKRGSPLTGAPRDLIQLASVDWSGFDPRLRTEALYVLCDVTNPLLGRRGSARVFGPQKGATPRQVKILERCLSRWSSFAKRRREKTPGAGAAGALAFGLSAFAGARLVRGTPFIIERLNWRAAAKRAQVIITGEGKLDATSFSGKVVGEIARRRGRALVWALCGATPLSAAELRRRGISAVESMGPRGLKNPARSLAESAKRIVRRGI